MSDTNKPLKDKPTIKEPVVAKPKANIVKKEKPSVTVKKTISKIITNKVEPDGVVKETISKKVTTIVTPKKVEAKKTSPKIKSTKKINVNQKINKPKATKTKPPLFKRFRKSENLKMYKEKIKQQKFDTSKKSAKILTGQIISTTGYKPNTDSYAIELANVYKSYITGDLETKVLHDINLQIKKGDFVVILGPSGSGKTTLLNIISGLDKSTEGDVFSLGHNLSLLKDVHLTKFRRDHVGFIFQQYNLLTNLTAKENAEVGENLARKKTKDLTIEDIFETIGMTKLINKYPNQLSGGEQQRVSIARALAKNPEILFGDEPTGALDEEMGRRVLAILLKVNKKYNTTIIVVTHNQNISQIANVVLHVKNGEIDNVKINKNPKLAQDIDWT